MTERKIKSCQLKIVRLTTCARPSPPWIISQRSSLAGVPEQERPASPLNLSVRHPFPKSELKCEDGRQLKQSSALSPILGVSPPRSASPPAWRSSQASPPTWSRGETARIWSPAVTCEKENSLSTSSNNNNNIEAKVSYLGEDDSKASTNTRLNLHDPYSQSHYPKYSCWSFM